MSKDRESIMRRVMALFAKAEGTDFEAEAASYVAKAQELMVRHSIEESELTPEEREQIAVKVVPVGKGTPDAILMSAVALASEVKFIRHNDDRGRGSLVGLPTDIAYVEAMYASLILQRERFLKRTEVPIWDSARSFNHSFRIGFAHRILQRLREAKQATVEAFADSAPGAELVLASKAKQMEQAFREKFPKTSKSRVTHSSGEGARAGRRAGSRADVSGGRNNLAGTNREAVSA